MEILASTDPAIPLFFVLVAVFYFAWRSKRDPGEGLADFEFTAGGGFAIFFFLSGLLVVSYALVRVIQGITKLGIGIYLYLS